MKPTERGPVIYPRVGSVSGVIASKVGTCTVMGITVITLTLTGDIYQGLITHRVLS